jgi:hypothetical protein
LQNRERKRKIINVFNQYFGIKLHNQESLLLGMSEEKIFIKFRKKHLKIIEDTAARVI